MRRMFLYERENGQESSILRRGFDSGKDISMMRGRFYSEKGFEHGKVSSVIRREFGCGKEKILWWEKSSILRKGVWTRTSSFYYKREVWLWKMMSKSLPIWLWHEYSFRRRGFDYGRGVDYGNTFLMRKESEYGKGNSRGTHGHTHPHTPPDGHTGTRARPHKRLTLINGNPTIRIWEKKPCFADASFPF